MADTQSWIIATGALFLCIFGSGVWLSSRGSPLHSGLLTVHKLVSLAALVLIGLTARQLRSQAAMSAVETGAAAVTALLFVFTIATGGVLSTGKPAPAAVLAAHRVTPFLTVLSTAVTLYLLAGGR